MVGEILRSGTPMLQSRPLGYFLVRYLPACNFGDGPEQERYCQADIQDNSSVSGWVIDAGITGPAAPVMANTHQMGLLPCRGAGSVWVAGPAKFTAPGMTKFTT